MLIRLVLLSVLFSQSVLNARELPASVNLYWEMNDKAEKMVQDLFNDMKGYKANGPISAVQSEAIHKAVKDFLRVMVRSRRLKRRIQSTIDKHVFHHKFSSLYGAKEKPSREELVDMLVYGLSDLLIYEYVSYFYSMVKDDYSLMKRLNETVVYGRKNHFNLLTHTYFNKSSKRNFLKIVRYLEKHRKDFESLYQEGDLFLKRLHERVDSGLLEEIEEQAHWWSVVKNYIRRTLKMVRINARRRLTQTEYFLVTRLMGDEAAEDKKLDGHKYIGFIPREELERVHTEVLQPGDVVIEKKEGTFGDFAIPGHFGHVAIYVGREDQLQDLKLPDGSLFLNHPVVQEVLPQIRAGKTTVESNLPKARMLDVRNWAVSDFAVLRLKSYPSELLGEALLKALRYNDTTYDYFFDVNTRNVVVCSELPYQVFDGVLFRTKKIVDRWTVSPDDVAVLAQTKLEADDRRPFELVYYKTVRKSEDGQPLARSEDESHAHYVQVLRKQSRYDDVPDNQGLLERLSQSRALR